MRAVAIEVSPLVPDTGARATLRFTDRDHARATVLNGERCWPGIIRNLALSREGWNGDWQNNVAPPQAALDVALGALRKADPDSPLYRWAGAPISVYAGELGALELLFDGLVEETSIRDGILKISGRVDDEPFLGDLLPLYGGRGAEDGGPDIADKPKPMCFGYCRNLEPVEINTAESIYQVHSGPVEEIVAVFERGIDFGVSVGDFPGYEALLAASVPEGRWATCHAMGLLRMGAPPFGVLTCDVKGDNTGGFHQTTAAIIRRVLQMAAVPADRIDEDSLDAFEAAVPYPVNVYLTSQESPLTLISRLALPCNAQTSFSWAGKLQVSRFADMPAPTFELDVRGESLPPVLDSGEQPVSPPWWRLEMQYGRAWRPHTRDELVFEEDLPEPQPTSVWGRFPSQPAEPEGNGIPEGWSPLRPQYVEATSLMLNPDYETYAADTFTAGPIWRSGAMQREGETTFEGWDYPVLDDPNYVPWTLLTHSTASRPLLSTNGIKAQPTYQVEPYFDFSTVYIPESITGPFNLSFRVRKGASMFSAGVLQYDPRLETNLSFEDFFAGVAVVVNNADLVDEVVQLPPLYNTVRLPVTGVIPFFDNDYTNGYVDDRIGMYLLDQLPGDDALYQITFNGQMLDVYVDGALARSTVLKLETWGIESFWPVFAMMSPDAEIYDIAWEPAELGQSTAVPMVESFGAMVFRQHLRQWEMKSAYDILEGFGYGFGISANVVGDCILSFEVNVPGGDSPPDPTPAFTQFCYLGGDSGPANDLGFGFKSDGTFSIYNDNSGAAWPYASFDKFSVEVRGRIARFFHNGAPIQSQTVSPGRTYAGYFELGKEGAVRRFSVRPYGSTDTVVQQTVEAASYDNVLTPADTSVNIGGYDYKVVATLPPLAFTVAPYTDPAGEGGTNAGQGAVRVSAAGLYRATVGQVQPWLRVQYSTDDGSSWLSLGETRANGFDGTSTGPSDFKRLSVGFTHAALSGTTSIIYRLLFVDYFAGVAPWELALESFTMTAEFSQ